MYARIGTTLVATAIFAAQPIDSPAGPVVPRRGAPPAMPAAFAAGHRVGLGATLTTSDGGQIFGFDIDRNGSDGVLASAKTVNSQGELHVSMQTFDEDTGKITKTFAMKTNSRDSYGVDGIFAGDTALVTHYIDFRHKIGARRTYDTMMPAAQGRFTGRWTPNGDIDVQQAVPDQTSSNAVLFAIRLDHNDAPEVLVSNVAQNTIAKVIGLDPNLFELGDAPQLGEYTAANEAVFALSPDGGRVGGEAPVNVLVDLTTGKTRQFNGLNNGTFGAGYVNGLAVDPNTGIAATTTELNAQVEFYDLQKEDGFAVQLPCTGPTSQSNSGAGIAVDPVHKLFLVTDPFYCTGSQGSALLVYDERGKLLETITGFGFFIGESAPAIDPAKRMGWAAGPQFSQLRQFFY